MNTDQNNSLFHTKQQKLKLSEIVEQFTCVDDKTINHTQFEYHKNIDFLSSAIVADSYADKGIFTISCCKSGALIREISHAEFSMLERIHGKEKAEAILQYKATQNCSAHWLQTDSKSLEKLAEYDPHGYFIHAASLVLKHKQEIYKNYHKLDDIYKKAAIDYAWQLQKHKAWKKLQKAPIEKIIKANELMRRYLAIVYDAKANALVTFDTVNLEDITTYGLPNFINNMQENLRTILEWAWKKNRIRRDLTIDDIIKLRKIFIGYTQFAGQRKVSTQPSYERLIEELTPFFSTPEIKNRLHQPTVTDEEVKYMQSGRTKTQSVGTGFKFSFADKKQEHKKAS